VKSDKLERIQSTLFSSGDNSVQTLDLNKKKERCREMPLSQRWYKAKQQHVSNAQKKALHDLWPLHGIDLKFGNLLNLDNLFLPPSNHTVLDIGFGIGDSIISLASSYPSRNFVGCEIHRAGLATALQNIARLNLTNIKLIRADVSMLLHDHFEERMFDEVCVYFPDPWPNDFRDKERRVIRPSILLTLTNVIKVGGILRVSTDVEAYAIHVETSVSQTNTILQSSQSERKWCLSTREIRTPQDPEPVWRPLTRYCVRAKELGHSIYDFNYQLT